MGSMNLWQETARCAWGAVRCF